MYSNAGLSHRLIACEDLTLNGEVDSTLEFIRKNLKSSAVPLNQTTSESSRMDRPSTHEAFIYRSLFTEEIKQNIRFQKNALPNASRAHCRVIHQTWGFPIKFFKDLKELLVSARDAVKEHQNFYQYGIVHRDIHSGNILICPTWKNGTYDFEETKGCLIDLDHAKFAPIPKQTLGEAQVSSKELEEDSEFLAYAREILTEKDLALSYVLTAIEYAKQLNHSFSEVNITPEVLGWHKPDPRPAFAQRKARRGVKTGTVAFMSSEMLTKDIAKYYGIRGNPPVIHDAVHDMESFLWLLLHFALTRTSGFEQHRNMQGENELLLVFDELFEGDPQTSGSKKARCILHLTEMRKLVSLMHPYFKHLEPFLLRWSVALNLAYQFRAYEYNHIHRIVIRILEDAIDATLPSSEIDAKYARFEVERRQAYYRDSCAMFKSTSVTETTIVLGADGSSCDTKSPPRKRSRTT